MFELPYVCLEDKYKKSTKVRMLSAIFVDRSCSVRV